MRSCARCNSNNALTAKFCQECGNSLLSAAGAPKLAAQEQGDLSKVIAQCREQLKLLKEPIPTATNAAVAPLMGSLQAIPAEALDARIAIIDALGKTREPVILRSLLMVSGARAKDVRRSVAVALGSIRHSLSAYMLLPMLEDGSSRVRNAAIQALMWIEQPHCIDAIFFACCKSKTFQRLTCDTLQRMKPFQKSRFSRELNQLSFSPSDSAITVRQTLLEFSQTNEAVQNQPSESASPVSHSTISGVSDSDVAMFAQNETNSLTRNPRPQHREEPPQKAFSHHGALPQQFEQPTSTRAAAPAQFDRTALEAHGSEYEEAGHNMPGRLKAANVSNVPLANNPAASQSLEEMRDFQASSDSFADLSFFESVSQDLNPSSYSAHLLPAAEFQYSGSTQDSSASGRSASSLLRANSEPANQIDATPAYNESAGHSPAHSAGLNPPKSSLAGLHGGSASSILRQAPAVSGIHHQPNMPPSLWAKGASAAGMTPQELSMYENSAPAPSPPTYPASAFVPAFAAPPAFNAASSTYPPPMMPITAPGQHPPQISIATVHSSHASDARLDSSTVRQAAAVADQPTITHAVIVHVSESVSSASTETADPESTAAEIAKVSQEKNLQRLREMRDRVFKALLGTQTSLTGNVPRLVSRKISALLTTPASDLPQIKKHLMDLGETESPHGIETFNSFSQKPSKEIRLACAEALGFIHTPSSGLLLLKFLSDKSGTVTEAAVKSLGKLGLPELHPVLLAAGLINPSLRTIVTSSAEGASDEQKNRWEQSLLTFSGADDADLSAFAISLLARLTGETHCEVFEKTVCSPHAAVRASSVDALVRTGKKRIIGLINEALVDPDPVVRRHAAAAVATVCSPRSVELLTQLLQDSNLSVRRTAAMTAGKLDEPDLGHGIVRALEQETDPVVVEALLEALQRNAGTDGLSVLTRYVECEEKQYRESGIKALRKLKSPDSIPVFRRLLDDGSPSIRKQCVEQLMAMKVSAALPRLRDMLRADSDENVRAVCAKAVGELQDQGSLHLLEAALEDHPLVRFQAIIGLGKLGNSAAGPSLLALLENSQPEIRYQAVRALGQVKLEGCEERVAPLLQDPDEMVRRGAEQTLMALGVTARQISSRKFRRRVAKVASAIAPSHLLGAIPGRGGTIVAVLGLFVTVGGIWLMSNAGSFVNGSSTLPVFRVESVRISSKAQRAAVWRNQDVLDILDSTNGELIARIQMDGGTSDVTIENEGGVLTLCERTLRRLDEANKYEPLHSKMVEFPQMPLATCFHAIDNLFCVFLPDGNGTQLQMLNAKTFQQEASHNINGRFVGRCVVSPDRKMALSLSGRGEFSIAELTSGDIFKMDLSALIKDGDIGIPLSVQFSRDMKHVCFCTTSNLFIFSVDKMSLEKQVKEEGGFFAVCNSVDGKIRAISSRGKVVEISADLANVSELKIDTYFDLIDVDAYGKQLILADSEARNAQVFDIEQNKVVAEIAGE